MTHKPSVGDKYKCTCDDHKPLRRGDIVTVEHVRTYSRKNCTLNLRVDGYGVQVNILQILKYVEPENNCHSKVNVLLT